MTKPSTKRKSTEVDAYISQFPLDRPLPLGLIAKIVQHRVRENRAKIQQ
jgi:hypothetical protein